MSVVCGIYKIESKIKPNRIYIGSTINFKNRKNRHFNDLAKNKHHNQKLQAHYNKYGEGDLVFSILAICDKKELIPINGVIWIEQCFLDAYNSSFNICRVTGNCMGRKQSRETIEKRISKIRGKPSKLKGTKHPWSDETKLRVREKKRGVISPVKGRPSKMKGKKTGIVPPNAFTKGHVPWNKGTAKIKEKKIRLKYTPIMAFKQGHTPWNKGKHTSPKMQEMLRGLGEKCKVVVLQYDKKGVFIKEWDSCARIQRDLKISASNVVQCAKGRIRSAGGYVWKYKDIV